jgi:hypothetical protein
MMQWEYKAVDLNDAPNGGDEVDLLKEFGAQGWELVTITANRLAFLKRPIPPAVRTSSTSSGSAKRST